MGDASGSGVSAQGRAFLKVVREGRSFSGRERHCLFLNNGQGEFFDVSAVTGFDLPDDGRGLAQVDWDQDGDLDFWISNRNGPQIRFLQNQLDNDQHFLKVRLVGTTSNRDAVGSRVRVFTDRDAKPISRTLTAGDSFLAQSSKQLHFGLGDSQSVERIEIKWPSGTLQTIRNPRIDTTCEITEGHDKLVYVPSQPPALPSDGVAESERSEGSDRQKTICFSMIGFPATTYETLDGTRSPLLNPSARLVLVNLWASWCAPCVEELSGLAAQARRLREQRIDVIALSVDRLTEPESSANWSDLLQQIKFPFRAGLADQALITKLQMLNDTIFELHNPLPLPTSFLVDKKRRVLIVYKGPVSVDELLSDSQRVRVKTTDEWRAVAVPFEGRWIMSPKRRHLFEFVEQLVERGFVDEARDYVQRNETMFTTHARWPQLQQKLILPRR